MAYLDILDKYNRIEKIREYSNKEEGWKNAMGRGAPEKIN